MLANKIKITPDDIALAEKILLPIGQTFDDERIDFITNLDTIDLQAVPGSGKTTVLLAKLLILERYVPFEDGSGILVISHTNAAIDEIKYKIGQYCPKLFSYPNFVGTIQRFVDEFLAIPYYINIYRRRPYRIDNEIYDERAKDFSSTLFKNFTIQEQNNAKRYLHVNDLYKKYRLDFDDNQNCILTYTINGNELDFKKPRGNTRPQNYHDWNPEEKEKVKKWLFLFKKELLSKGVLCFDDAYFLAKLYIVKLPKIKSFLQKRFCYVFVDEMQDMDKHQCELLENLFYDNGISSSKYQRIGDKNQAIFNEVVKLDNIWRNRNRILELNGSFRLSSLNAKAVKYFGLDFLEIEGRNKNSDGSEIAIKPHLFVFEDNTIKMIIPKFKQIIQKHQKEGAIPVEPKYPFKAIAWRKEHQDKDKFALKDYFDFEERENNPKIDYPSFKSYLNFFDKNKKTLDSIRKNIINALLKILRYENVSNENGRNYTRRKLLTLLREMHPEAYEKFKLNLYRWSIRIVKGQMNEIYDVIVSYIPEFLSIFGTEIHQSKIFIDSVEEPKNIETNNNKISRRTNIYNHENIEIEVTTVHSVKGQTHTATLYMESFYSRGKGNYESERLAEQFKGKKLSDGILAVVKQSARMTYVGFSRPTHLLCFAVHKNRYEKYLNDINTEEWEIVEVE